MTPQESAPDKELMDRYRRAGDTEAIAPSEATRAAILAEAGRVAQQRASETPRPALDTSRPAANDSRWKIPVFGAAGAALLAVLIFAPRYWESVPTAPVSSAPPAAPAANAPAAASKLEEVKPLEPEQTNANTQSAARRNFARAAPPAVASPGAAPSIQSSAALGDVTQTAALLDQGAPVDAPDEMGRTPLMLAVMQNRPAVVRLLLARGADPNAADNTGHTPLQQAKQENLRDVAAMLERAGAR